MNKSLPKPCYNRDGLTLYCEQWENILPRLQEDTVSAFLTDPPFGINYQNHFTANKHKVLQNDDNPYSYRGWSREAFRLQKDGTALFAFSSWGVFGDHVKQIEKSGFVSKEPLVVQKRMGMGSFDLKGTFQTNSDWIIFAHKGKFRFQPTNLLRNKNAFSRPNKGRKRVPLTKTRFPSCWFGPQFPYSTDNPIHTQHRKHPTVKTVKIMQWLILLSTNSKDLIVDPFSGSGTTLAAAYETGRRCIGIEVSEEHCERTIQRLRDLRQKPTPFIASL